MNIIYKIYILNMEESKGSRSNTISMMKNLELILMPVNAATVIGVILLCISGPLKVVDLEIWGYYLMAFSILLSFLILIGWKGILNKKSEQSTGMMGNILSIFGLVVERLPALLLFGQLVYLAVNTNTTKEMFKGDLPELISSTKWFISLFLFVQLLIYFKFYTVSLKNTESPSFNSAMFAIISLCNVFLMIKLNMYIEYLRIDG